MHRDLEGKMQMNRWNWRLPAVAFALAVCAAACGGGGGAAVPSTTVATSPTTTPSTAPTNAPTASPPPLNAMPTPAPIGATPGPQLNGTMQIVTGGTASASGAAFTYVSENAGSLVVFSCGCTTQAGENLLTAGGTFSIPTSTLATPASPSPTYTSVPGRNYLVVATQNGGSTTEGNGAESWTMEFLGNTAAHDVGLGLNGSVTSDAFTAAAALYVYANSENNSTAFDEWNLNTILAWVNHMRAGGPNAAEQKLLNDIAAAQEARTTLYPVAPPWYPTLTANGTIQSDLTAVATSGDTALPTPCPGGQCTGTPSP
jgi:hypothetical protein